jgi:peptide/nickel transport system substrate-binding protein
VSVRPSRAGVAGLLALALVAGCAGDENEGTPALSAGEPLGEGGTLVWAVADRVNDIDPLAADTRAEQLLTRQIHEPLVASLAGPFGDTRRVPGLARAASTSGDATIWTFRLRTGVDFQDGSPFNAEAVLANAERWQSTADGRELLPGLVDVFAPQSDVVRFILAEPDRAFDERLADPRLGIVLPEALSDIRRDLGRPLETGTGPFELRERSAESNLLAQNTSWWGVEADLGPALEQIEIRAEPSSAVRLALLDAGGVELADELDSAQAQQALADPLLHALRGARGTWLGLSRAVRGVTSGREIPSLSAAWLATVTVAD